MDERQANDGESGERQEAEKSSKSPVAEELKHISENDPALAAQLVHILSASNEEAEEEIAPTTRRHLRRWATVQKHEFIRWWRARGLLERLLGVAAYLFLPLQALFTVGLNKMSALGVAFLLVMQFRSSWKETAYPKNREMQERTYLERALYLQRLLYDLGSWFRTEPTAADIARFRRDVLHIVAVFVREHRADMTQSIFANLLVEDGDVLVVVARDRHHRQPGARYPKEHMLAWEAFVSGEPVSTGNVREEYPTLSSGKKYCSILAVPILGETGVAGVLSIDSTHAYHFDNNIEELCNSLGPYIELLALTFRVSCATQTRSRSTGEITDAVQS